MAQAHRCFNLYVSVPEPYQGGTSARNIKSVAKTTHTCSMLYAPWLGKHGMIKLSNMSFSNSGSISAVLSQHRDENVAAW